MNWAQELLNLYDKNQELVGDIVEIIRQSKKDNKKTQLILLPVSHTTVLAQITVTVDADGNLIKAETVAEDERVTIIPITEKSGSRTAGAEPHPLCDNLKYIAGDYMTYYAGKEGKKDKDFSKNYELYINGLRAWNDSEYTHKKVQAVYRYLEKGCLIKDLVQWNILHLNEDGKMSENDKISGIPQTDAFVRFRIVEAEEMTAEMLQNGASYCKPECWLDKTLFQSFIAYYQSFAGEKGLSYLTGNCEAISYLHPKKIRNEGDGGKLFSSNDETYFTFRGRFADKSEAVSIGYMDSQKIHNALKWIIRKQGYRWEDLTVVIWSSDLQPLPDIKADTDAICNEFEGWGDEKEDTEKTYDTDEMGAKRFEEAMRGYERQFDKMSTTVLLALDSATSGRVSMAENRVLLSSNYIRCLQFWHESCRWRHTKYKNGKRISYSGMAGIESLAKTLYGTEQNGMLSLSGNTKICGELYKRLLPCMVDRRKVPEDLVKLAVHRASSPMKFKEWYNWEYVLETACSLVKKQYYDKNPREEWKVALEKDCKERDYLYGRLLAAAHWAELRTYKKEERRETNAQRYMNAFSQRPMQTWKVIEERVGTYLPKLKPEEYEKYINFLAEIFSKFSVETFKDEKPLGGLYLLGFHSQFIELKSYQENNAENKEEDKDE